MPETIDATVSTSASEDLPACVTDLCSAPRVWEDPKSALERSCKTSLSRETNVTYKYKAMSVETENPRHKSHDVVVIPDAAFVFNPADLQDAIAPHACKLTSWADESRCMIGVNDHNEPGSFFPRSEIIRCRIGVHGLDTAFIPEPGSPFITKLDTETLFTHLEGRTIHIVSDSVGRGLYTDIVCGRGLRAVAYAHTKDSYALRACTYFEHDILICQKWHNFELADKLPRLWPLRLPADPICKS
ncbi:uncharacterized protein AMSG_08012, partial [Thecamonas trahens ATCC 50062]